MKIENAVVHECINNRQSSSFTKNDLLTIYIKGWKFPINICNTLSIFYIFSYIFMYFTNFMAFSTLFDSFLPALPLENRYEGLKNIGNRWQYLCKANKWFLLEMFSRVLKVTLVDFNVFILALLEARNVSVVSKYHNVSPHPPTRTQKAQHQVHDPISRWHHQKQPQIIFPTLMRCLDGLLVISSNLLISISSLRAA